MPHFQADDEKIHQYIEYSETPSKPVKTIKAHQKDEKNVNTESSKKRLANIAIPPSSKKRKIQDMTLPSQAEDTRINTPPATPSPKTQVVFSRSKTTFLALPRNKASNMDHKHSSYQAFVTNPFFQLGGNPDVIYGSGEGESKRIPSKIADEELESIDLESDEVREMLSRAYRDNPFFKAGGAGHGMDSAEEE